MLPLAGGGVGGIGGGVGAQGGGVGAGGGGVPATALAEGDSLRPSTEFSAVDSGAGAAGVLTPGGEESRGSLVTVAAAAKVRSVAV